MTKRFRAPRRAFILLVLVAGAVAALAATTGHTTAAAAHVMRPASTTLHVPAGKPLPGTRGSVVFTCQTAKNAFCYGPAQIRAAYDINPLLSGGYDGSGRTIVIIDAYGSPTINSDLALFDSVWGLPAPDFKQVAPYGIDKTAPDASDWAGETSLDVEWSHAVAPGAKILLVVARSSNDSDILDATQWVLDNNAGDVVSQSYGEAEQCMDSTQLARQHSLFQQMTQAGITLFASSGDQGAGIPTCSATATDEYFKATSTPASDPYVTSVGGTMLHAQGISGAYQSETTWNESGLFDDAVAGGGGVSVVYDTPDYQKGVNSGAFRTVPDVSYNAGVYTGVITALDGGFWLFGGTSAGSPQWAGLTAIADQLAGQRLGLINPTLYKAGTGSGASTYFNDIADGSNNSVPNFLASDPTTQDGSITGFTAVPGYDLATGLGTPNADHLMPFLGSSVFTGRPNYHGNERGVGHHNGHKQNQ